MFQIGCATMPTKPYTLQIIKTLKITSNAEKGQRSIHKNAIMKPSKRDSKRHGKVGPQVATKQTMQIYKFEVNKFEKSK